jgi:hypothetical protein
MAAPERFGLVVAPELWKPARTCSKIFNVLASGQTFKENLKVFNPFLQANSEKMLAYLQQLPVRPPGPARIQCILMAVLARRMRPSHRRPIHHTQGDPRMKQKKPSVMRSTGKHHPPNNGSLAEMTDLIELEQPAVHPGAPRTDCLRCGPF